MSRGKLMTAIVVLLAMLATNDITAQRIEVRVGPRYAAPSRPPCPGPDYAWVEGRWVWDNYYRRDVWVEGYWRRLERDYYCNRDCGFRHEHHYKKNKHRHDNGRRYNDRYSDRYDDRYDDDYSDRNGRRY